MEGDYLYERVLRAINENGSINVSLTLEDLKQGFEKLEADMNNLYGMYDLEILFKTIGATFHDDSKYKNDKDHNKGLEQISNTLYIDFFERIKDLDDKREPDKNTLSRHSNGILLNQKTKLRELLEQFHNYMKGYWKLYKLSEDEFNELNKRTADQFSSYISRGNDDLDAVFKEMVILPLMKNIEIGMDVNRDKDKWDSFSVPGAKYTEDLSKILNEFYKDIDTLLKKKPEELVTDAGQEYMNQSGEWQVYLQQTPWLINYRRMANVYLFMYQRIVYELVMILVNNVIPMIKNVKEIANGSTKLDNSIGLIILMKQVMTKKENMKYFLRGLKLFVETNNYLLKLIRDNKRNIINRNRPITRKPNTEYVKSVLPNIIEESITDPSSSKQSSISGVSDLIKDDDYMKGLLEGLDSEIDFDKIDKSYKKPSEKGKKIQRTKKKKKRIKLVKELVPAVSGNFFYKPRPGDYVTVDDITLPVTGIDGDRYIIQGSGYRGMIKLSEIFQLVTRSGELFDVKKELDEYNRGINRDSFIKKVKGIKDNNKILIEITGEIPSWKKPIPDDKYNFTNKTDNYLLGTITIPVNRHDVEGSLLFGNDLGDFKLHISYDDKLLSLKFDEFTITEANRRAMIDRHIREDREEEIDNLHYPTMGIARQELRDIDRSRSNQMNSRMASNVAQTEGISRGLDLESRIPLYERSRALEEMRGFTGGGILFSRAMSRVNPYYESSDWSQRSSSMNPTYLDPHGPGRLYGTSGDYGGKQWFEKFGSEYNDPYRIIEGEQEVCKLPHKGNSKKLKKWMKSRDIKKTKSSKGLTEKEIYRKINRKDDLFDHMECKNDKLLDIVCKNGKLTETKCVKSKYKAKLPQVEKPQMEDKIIQLETKLSNIDESNLSIQELADLRYQRLQLMQLKEESGKLSGGGKMKKKPIKTQKKGVQKKNKGKHQKEQEIKQILSIWKPEKIQGKPNPQDKQLSDEEIIKMGMKEIDEYTKKTKGRKPSWGPQKKDNENKMVFDFENMKINEEKKSELEGLEKELKQMGL